MTAHRHDFGQPTGFRAGPAWLGRHATPSQDADTLGKAIAAQCQCDPRAIDTFIDALRDVARNAARARRAGL